MRPSHISPTVLGNQNENRLGLTEAGQVQEITVLAIGKHDIVIAHPRRRGLQDDDGIVSCHAHQLAASPGVFFLLDHCRCVLFAPGVGRRRATQ
jgi:hypothetical protein